MTVTTTPDLHLTLRIDPEDCWRTYEMLVANESLIRSLGRARLEALARLVRELSLNTYHHGGPGSSGSLSGDLGQRSFEVRFCSEPFDSVAQAQKSQTGGLFSGSVVLAEAGGIWEYRWHGGWNIYEIRF
ncbi:hypothetical protein ACFL6C_09355 [Myxococcota bacterium]